MASAFSQLAGAPLANLLVLAALVAIGIAIFGWGRETVAASSGFRGIAGLAGALLLLFVYGFYLPSTTRSRMNALSSPSSTQQPTAPTEESTTPLLPKDGRNGAPRQQQSAQSSTPQAAAQNLFSGRWKNADPKGASILFLKVDERGGEISVRAWGTCLPQRAGSQTAGDPAAQYCDWGTGHGVVRDGAATVIWKQETVLRRMKLEPDGGSLRVVLDTTWRGRPSQHTEAHFAKSL